MSYPHTVKIDKNKITIGLAKRLQAGSLDAVIDLVAACTLIDGVKPPREQILAAIEDMTLEELTTILEAVAETLTPKAT